MSEKQNLTLEERIERLENTVNLQYLVNLFKEIKIPSGETISSDSYFATLTLGGDLIEYARDDNTLTIKHKELDEKIEETNNIIYSYVLLSVDNKIILQGTPVGIVDKYGHVTKPVNTEQVNYSVDIDEITGALSVKGGEDGAIIFS